MNPLRRLASQTAVYGISSVLGRLLNYLLVPLLTFLLSSIADAVFTFESSGTIVLCNHAVETLSGKTIEEIRGKNINEIITLVNERSLDPLGDIVETFFGEEGAKERRYLLQIDGVHAFW